MPTPALRPAQGQQESTIHFGVNVMRQVRRQHQRPTLRQLHAPIGELQTQAPSHSKNGRRDPPCGAPSSTSLPRSPARPSTA